MPGSPASADGDGSSTQPIQHATRAFHAFPGSKYALPTDDLERQRLTIQHISLKTIFENKIVLAPVVLGPDDKVLDVGTGPGLWVLDLAASVASIVPMVAIDIDARLFPTCPPKNIDFRIETITKLPGDWTDSFSFVHQRLLVFALQKSEWPIALSEIHRVLRPGGWVQLGEIVVYPEGVHPDRPYLEKLVSIARRMVEAHGIFADCAKAIPMMLKEAGFVDIHCESRDQPMGQWAGDLGAACSQNLLNMFKGIKTPVLNGGGYGLVTSEEEYDTLVAGLQKEWDDVPSGKAMFLICWARKQVS